MPHGRSNRNRRPTGKRSGKRNRNHPAAGSTPQPNLDALAPQPLSPAGSQSIAEVHLRSWIRQPNVYRKRIRTVVGNPAPGDWVAVYVNPQDPDTGNPDRRTVSGTAQQLPPIESSEPELLGYGIYNPRSEITLRVLRFGVDLPDSQFWQSQLRSAVEFRTRTLGLDEVCSAYRVIHGESDGLSGLVVDRYGDVLSAEAFSLGMYQRAPEVLDRLQELCGTRHTILRTSPQILSQEGFDRPAILSTDCPKTIKITEYGTEFQIRLGEESHKTGFFCDQRENRLQLAKFCGGKSVLDLCCYSGGFSVQAARLGRAGSVTGVDLDEAPLDVARTNVRINKLNQVRFVQADVFPFMRDMIRNGRQFDVVVLDPPKLIRTRAEVEEGTRKHYDLNRLAMRIVAPGGLLLTCTCAGLLPAAEFQQLVCRAARNAGDYGDLTERTIRIFDKSGAAADHPIAGNCPETEYLQALWVRVD